MECPAAEDGVVVSRSILDELCRELVGRTVVTCDAALPAAHVQPGAIDAMITVIDGPKDVALVDHQA